MLACVLSMIQTWEEAIEVATFLNKTNWDPTIRGRMAFCFNKPAQGQFGVPQAGSYLLTVILGSMTQYTSRSQGLLFDPLTMEPLVSDEGQHHSSTGPDTAATRRPGTVWRAHSPMPQEAA